MIKINVIHLMVLHERQENEDAFNISLSKFYISLELQIVKYIRGKLRKY